MLQNIVSFIVALDEKFFYFINSTTANPLFDALMPFITNTRNFHIPFLLIFSALVIFGNRYVRIGAVSIVAGVILSDIISSKILKEVFARPRPFEVMMSGIRQLCGAAGASMPSSHAVNSFCAATIAALFFNKKISAIPSTGNHILKFIRAKWVGVVCYFFAFLSAYSRVYVGVHYPTDVIGGALLGMLIGWGVYKGVKKIFKKMDIPA